MSVKPNSRRTFLAGIGAAATLLLPKKAGSAASGSQQTVAHLENPFVGATFCRNVDCVAAVNAAVAGRWFQAQFVELVKNAFPPFEP